MNRLLRAAVAAAGIYEAAAIATRRAPTLSALTWRYRAHPVGAPVVFGLWAWLTFHLFVEGATT